MAKQRHRLPAHHADCVAGKVNSSSTSSSDPSRTEPRAVTAARGKPRAVGLHA